MQCSGRSGCSRRRTHAAAGGSPCVWPASYPSYAATPCLSCPLSQGRLYRLSDSLPPCWARRAAPRTRTCPCCRSAAALLSILWLPACSPACPAAGWCAWPGACLLDWSPCWQAASWPVHHSMPSLSLSAGVHCTLSPLQRLERLEAPLEESYELLDEEWWVPAICLLRQRASCS